MKSSPTEAGAKCFGFMKVLDGLSTNTLLAWNVWPPGNLK